MGKKKPVDLGPMIHVRNSERGTLDRCPQQWYWSWREGLRPKETAKPLWFGTGIHVALAHYYAPGFKRRKDFIDVWRAYANEEAEYMRINVGGIDEDVFVEARALGESMLSEYVKEYDHDRDWDVIATEQSFELQVPLFSGGDDRDTEAFKDFIRAGQFYDGWDLDNFILNGTMDGVYRSKSDRKTKLMEHKTAKAISTAHLPMDNQAGTYWMVAHSVGKSQGWLKPKENISDITYNFLKKGLPDARPKDGNGYATNKPGREHYVEVLRRHDYPFAFTGTGQIKPPTIAVMEEWASAQGLTVIGERSKIQPPALFERHEVRRTPNQRASQLRRLQDEVQNSMLIRSGQTNITKSPDRGHCGFCAFKEMCELHEAGGDWEGYRDVMFRSSDPYADHRKSAAG